ncbi:MAG: zinc ribbon domain-containing protein [Kiritimatiellae bacterium]|nr:zinc ribbon domain-containing protein [Kiritimatiellia bacterium]
MNKMIALMIAVVMASGALYGEDVPLNRIPGAGSVRIPDGVSDAQALAAVEKAADNRGSWILGRWTVETRDPSNRWTRVVLSVRSHTLTACYRIENGLLIPDIPQSTNLNQHGSQIDSHVAGWICRFNRRVEENLRVAQRAAAVPAVVAAPAKPVVVAPAQPAVAVPSAVPAAVPADAPRFCEGCGKKVSADANFCGACGRKLK